MYYLGIDVGATKIKAVLLKNFSGKTTEHFVIDTPSNKKNFLSALEHLIIFIAEKKKISGVGVGLPGIVDMKKGILVKAPNLPFLDSWNVKKFFQKFSRRVVIDNDSRCFLRAEACYGAAKGYHNVIGITIGTGVGGGIMIGEKIYSGGKNGAGEFGHMVFPVLNSKFQILNSYHEWEKLIGKKAYEQNGDRSVMIGIGIANLINGFDPDIVVLGGGGVTSGVVKIAIVRRVAKKYVMSPLGKKTPIVAGRLGYFAQAIGAAFLIRNT